MFAHFVNKLHSLLNALILKILDLKKEEEKVYKADQVKNSVKRSPWVLELVENTLKCKNHYAEKHRESPRLFLKEYCIRLKVVFFLLPVQTSQSGLKITFQVCGSLSKRSSLCFKREPYRVLSWFPKTRLKKCWKQDRDSKCLHNGIQEMSISNEIFRAALC